ncbi:efflux RND transporter periplasmic adaptor subunit [Pseudidiomarina marina]|uniref:Efflux transporter periplasmic adaptor subunit n=1 Tax=Pseudidiomarina marina TaxID=502366 RepID=A0A432YJS2_9GAMM|nr:efflux RND transporter periplasmic adaptor subunit [Pseudidiomarina marina]PHR66940.1 MAG: efflux transporter periplasmic adaptor subunit [Idiomarina sp.]RUO61204.1 efflux transporter periplasmic adaptor subunit [Pseudidiomarina marina]
MQWLNRLAVIGCLVVGASVIPSSLAQQWGGDRAAWVVMQPVGFERVQRSVEAVGYAEAQRSVALYPAVGDLVLEVNFQPGERVEQGDVLVRLDDRQQQVDLQRARIELEDAERTVRRLTTSRQQGAISQSELDIAVTARDLLKVAAREAEIAYEDRQVRAPFDGVLGITDVEPGDRITTQTLISTIDKREQLYIDFKAPEAAMELLQRGAELIVRPWASRGQAIPAEIVEVDSRVDLTNRTIRVRAAIDNSNDLYRPGMSFRAALTYQGDSYAVVPEAALMWSADGAYVWVEKDGKAQRVDVNIEQRLEGRILVSGELQLGDNLIVEGVQSLRAGQSVREAPAAESQS